VDDFVWVLQISGAAPASHFVNGYKGASSERQSPMYFPLGGGTLKGIGKAGEIVWSRVLIENGALHADRIAPRGDGPSLEEYDQPMATRERRFSWRLARCAHGETPGKPYQHCVRARRIDSGPGAGRQIRDVL
jgi:hypothetical protein